MTVLSETRERFLKAILADVALDQIAEIHFFHPIRQGGIESGVAVVAEAGGETGEARELPSVAPSTNGGRDSPRSIEDSGRESESFLSATRLARVSRFTIHTARYRLVLKGPDRGTWDVSIVAEADAPLLTVDAVVRGVQRRSGDAEEVTRMTRDEIAALLPDREDSAA